MRGLPEFLHHFALKHYPLALTDSDIGSEPAKSFVFRQESSWSGGIVLARELTDLGQRCGLYRTAWQNILGHTILCNGALQAMQIRIGSASFYADSSIATMDVR
jgi:hypothetical protein